MAEAIHGSFSLESETSPESDEQSTSNSELSISLKSIFLWLKAAGFYAHDPATRPRSYESTLATFYAALLITLNIFLFAFHVSAIEKSSSDDGFWRAPTMSLVIAAVRPVHCAFNLGLFRRGYLAHQQFWQQATEIDQFFSLRLQVITKANRIKAIFLLIASLIVLVPAGLSSTQIILEHSWINQEQCNVNCSGVSSTSVFDLNRNEALALVCAPVQYSWQLLPLLYYAHVGWLLLFWYRNLHSRVDGDWEEYGRRRRRPLEFYSRQYTKLTEAVFAAGQFFHPLIIFSLAHSTVVLCMAVYFMKNANTIFDSTTPASTPKENEKVSRKIYGVAWTALQILVAFAYVVTVCFLRWQLKLRACMVAANILSYNRRVSRDYSSIRDSSVAITDRRRQWRRRCRSECHQHERHQQAIQGSTVIIQPATYRHRRRLTLLAIPRPVLPTVWSASMSTRRRDNNHGSTYL